MSDSEFFLNQNIGSISQVSQPATTAQGSQPGQELSYLCSASINIGYSTNNIAEYVGVIMALTLSALNEVKHVQVRTDSDLMAKQIKGLITVRNVRLVYIVPMVHDLIKHFKSVQIDWIPRA